MREVRELYFFFSTPVSYRRFLKRFPTESSAIKYFGRFFNKQKSRRCVKCRCYQSKPYRKDNPRLRQCVRCGTTFSIFRNTVFQNSKSDFRYWMYVGYCMTFYYHCYFSIEQVTSMMLVKEIGCNSMDTIYRIHKIMSNEFTKGSTESIVFMRELFLPLIRNILF